MSAVYQTILQSLRNLIKSDYTPGAKFPTEREIATKFKISRPTANKILSALVAEGVLEFRKGVGTFVTQGSLGYDLRRLVSFTEKARAAGKKPRTEVLKLELLDSWLELPREILVKLRVAQQQKVYYFERLRLADKMPVIFERRYVPQQLCPDLTKDKLKGSLYALWTEHYNLAIAGAEQTISAINLTPNDARLMKVSTGTAALKVTALGYLIEKNQPLWYEETIYRSDMYSFETTLGGLGPMHSAVGRLELKPAV